MKKYNITVNGNTYEVEVEEVGSDSNVSRPSQVTKEVKPQKPKTTSKPKKESKETKKETNPEPKAVPQGAETINAPMPGSVLDIKVSEGDTVNEGDVLLILEAMKMENEIVAPRSGKVSVINTSKGASVNSGDPLISLE